MSSLPAREFACSSSLDHLHTQTPALAGTASTAPDGTDAPTFTRRARRLTWRRVLALPLAVFGLAVAASAASMADAADDAAAPAAGPNVVTGFGGAPDLNREGGLSVASPLLDIAANPAGDGYWLVGADGGVFTYGDARFFGSLGGTRLNAPVVDIAPTPTGAGYWLVAGDGGVFSFGDAAFQGSLGGQTLPAPVLGIASSPTGNGYWLVSADGGVFAFGDAGFYGSGIELSDNAPVVELAATVSGDGYWLLAADGGVFAFGDASFEGADVDPENRDAIGIAASLAGEGYWVLRRSGAVGAFGVEEFGGLEPVPSLHPAIAITARAAGGYWIVQGEQQRIEPAVVPPPPVAPDISQHPFLVCTRRIESNGNYSVVSASGTYRGAYQFSRSTWDSTARHFGRPELVGVDPAAASPPDQDAMALHLYGWQGARPWLGRCAGL